MNWRFRVDGPVALMGLFVLSKHQQLNSKVVLAVHWEWCNMTLIIQQTRCKMEVASVANACLHSIHPPSQVEPRIAFADSDSSFDPLRPAPKDRHAGVPAGLSAALQGSHQRPGPTH